ncbi:hypothetical protein [Orrella sp. 11846]|uniref:hypothetical protein n=1 Tax=Orrella sp. 11846 TaxID=3409913 RepID=UPI003B5A8D8C
MPHVLCYPSDGPAGAHHDEADQRYRNASRDEKGLILDEFVALTHYHRKYAIRLLNAVPDQDSARRSHRNRVYDEAVRQALVVLWETAQGLDSAVDPSDGKPRAPGSGSRH